MYALRDVDYYSFLLQIILIAEGAMDTLVIMFKEVKACEYKKIYG